MIRKLDPQLFTWSRWRRRSVAELDLICRYIYLTSPRGKAILHKYTVGWCRGETLVCRPKADCIAIMLFKDGEHWWFHLQRREFEEIFE